MTHFFKLAICLILIASALKPASAISQGSVTMDELAIEHVTIIAKDIKTTAAWYRRFLKFVVIEYQPEKKVRMRRGEFQLVIIRGKSTLLLREITFTKGKKYVNGIDKIGFDTNQLDSLNIYFDKYEQKILDPIHLDNNLGKRTMIVADPEGNKVQFFDQPNDQERFSMIPTFFSINSSDYGTTLKWYTSHMGFREIELHDDTNAHFQNFLQNGSIILELLHLPFESLETTEFMPIDRDLGSYDQMIFRTGLAKKTVFQMDNTGNKIVLKR